MGKLIPNLLVLHSADLEDRLIDETKACGMSKSSIARDAIDRGFPRVMEMSRGQILSATRNTEKMTVLPRVGAHLARQTDKLIRDFSATLDIPVWRIYSLSIDAGLDCAPQLPLAQNSCVTQLNFNKENYYEGN